MTNSEDPDLGFTSCFSDKHFVNPRRYSPARKSVHNLIEHLPLHTCSLDSPTIQKSTILFNLIFAKSRIDCLQPSLLVTEAHQRFALLLVVSAISLVPDEFNTFAAIHGLTLKAPIATKVVCFSRLLKCLRSLYGKQCGPRSDCSYRSSLFWVHTVCFYT